MVLTIVHNKFFIEALIELKKHYPDAAVWSHPECKGVILKLADVAAKVIKPIERILELSEKLVK